MSDNRYFQEMPPKQGYPTPVQWKRNLPARGFRPSIYFWGTLGIMGYGWYLLINGSRERNELYREKVWSRFHIQPLLQAEADRDELRRVTSLRKAEQEVMSDVADFDAEASVYNDGKYHKPTLTSFPRF